MNQGMKIQWYPGHMFKAGKEIKNTMSEVDVVIEIVDARIPYSSQNPLLKQLRAGKPCITVLNKSDLADSEITLTWQHYLEREHTVKTLAISCLNPEEVKQIPALCLQAAPRKSTHLRPIHALIMGIPNVGKSTIINILAGKTIAKTGNEPAVTRQQQVIKINPLFTLLDTPGMLWPNIENKNSGYRLACTGAVKETAMESADVALYALDYMLKHYPDRLQVRYLFEHLPDEDIACLEAIGTQRGCLRKGGHVDLDKAARLFLTELRASTLGPITFEKPDMIAAEEQEVENQRALKAARKAERKKAVRARRRKNK